MTIWKYALDLTDAVQRVSMPRNARILCVHVQRNTLCLWAEVDTFRQADPPFLEPRAFVVRPTGALYLAIDGEKYIGSVFFSDVFHVFEVPA